MAPEKKNKKIKSDKMLQDSSQDRKRHIKEEPTIEHPCAKIKKLDSKAEIEAITSRFLGCLEKQHQEWKQSNENLWTQFSEITSQIHAESSIIKENEQKLQKLTCAFMKCLQQTTDASKDKLNALNDMDSFITRFEEMESQHKKVTEKLLKQIDTDVKKLEMKYYKENKKRQADNFLRNINNMIQNEFLNL